MKFRLFFKVFCDFFEINYFLVKRSFFLVKSKNFLVKSKISPSVLQFQQFIYPLSGAQYALSHQLSDPLHQIHVTGNKCNVHCDWENFGTVYNHHLRGIHNNTMVNNIRFKNVDKEDSLPLPFLTIESINTVYVYPDFYAFTKPWSWSYDSILFYKILAALIYLNRSTAF